MVGGTLYIGSEHGVQVNPSTILQMLLHSPYRVLKANNVQQGYFSTNTEKTLTASQ